MVRFKNRYVLIQLIPFIESKCGVAVEDVKDVDNVEDVEMAETVEVGIKRRYSSTVDSNSCGSTNSPGSSTESPLKLSFDLVSVSNYLKRELAVNFGAQGSASLSQPLVIKYTNSATGMIILRCPRDHLHRVCSTVAWMTHFPAYSPAGAESLPPVRCTWRVIHCAGTIKACQQAAISFARREGKLTPEISKKISNLDV